MIARYQPLEACRIEAVRKVGSPWLCWAVIVFLYFQFTIYAYCQTNDKFVSILVLDSQKHGVANVILGTTKRTCKPTDNLGQTRLPLGDDDRIGAKLELFVLFPAEMQVSMQSARWITDDRSLYIVLKKRPLPETIRSNQAEELAQARVENARTIIEVADSSFVKGTSLFSDHKFDDAVSPLTVASNLIPDEPKFKNLLGMCYIELRQFTRAEDILNAARILSFGQEKGEGPLTRDIEANLKQLHLLMAKDPTETVPTAKK